MVSVVQFRDPTQGANRYDMVKYELPEQPRQVRIELARNCTAACPWCSLYGRDEAFRAKAPGTELGFMDMQMFERIIDDIATWPKPLQELSPTNYGEMLMNKQWLPMLQLVERKLPKTGLAVVTTGIALNDENLEKLASITTLAYLNMSINAYFSETWERQHRRPAKLMTQCVAAVHKFRDRRPDVRTNVSLVYDTEYVTELERDLFLAYWRPFGSVTINERSYAGWPDRGPQVPVTLPCRSVFDGLVVFNDGNVGTGCCVLPTQGILMMKGSKNIEDIVVGDRVYTHRGRIKTVLQIFQRPYTGIVQCITPKDGPKLKVTPEHPILTAHGWKPAGKLTIKDRVMTGIPSQRPKFFTSHIRSISTEQYTGPVYNLEVADDHSYVIGVTSLHNCFDGLKEPSLNVGHVPEEKLLDIWRGEKLRAVAETHNAGRRATLPLCARCTYA